MKISNIAVNMYFMSMSYIKFYALLDHVFTTVILLLLLSAELFISKTSADNELCRTFDFSIFAFNNNLVPQAATLVAN